MSSLDENGVPLGDLDPVIIRADLDDLRDEFHRAQEEVEHISHSPRINERLWFGWTRWRWIVVERIFLYVVLFFAFWMIVHNADENESRNKAQDVERCYVQADGRERVRDLLFALTDPGDRELTPEQAVRIKEIRDLSYEILPPINCSVEGVPSVNG